MMGHLRPLFSSDFIANWQGMSLAGEALRSSGFALHYIYQDEVTRFCHGQHDNRTIGEYWMEVARELLSSGQFASDRVDRGAFRSKSGFYNSSILDGCEKSFLTENKGGLTNISSHVMPNVHRCARDVLYALEVGLEIREVINNRIYNRRVIEQSNFDYCQKYGAGKRDVNSLFYQIASKHGFKKIDITYKPDPALRNVACLKLDNGLIIYSFIDLIRFRRDKFPGNFSISWFIGAYNISIDHDISLGNLGNIVPGLEYYSYNTWDYIGFELGFSAYFACASELAKSFMAASALR